jgi:hypothetical protein
MTTSLTGGGTSNLDALSVAGAASIGGALSLVATPNVSTAQSMVRVNTANGYGSTNTKIRRFTNVVTNQGSDITYADSATLGATFTINTNGVYALQYDDQFTGVTNMGWSLNTTAPTTSILAIPIAEVICIQDASGANIVGNAACVLYLPSGSVVRCHTSGTATGVNTNGCQVTVTRVA